MYIIPALTLYLAFSCTYHQFCDPPRQFNATYTILCTYTKEGKKLNKKTNNTINKCNNEINKQISKDEIQTGNKHRGGNVRDHQASEKCKPKLS